MPSAHIAELRFAPGLALARHEHSEPTVAVILAGGFDGSLAGRASQCAAMTTRVEPAGEPHTNRFGPQGARILVLQPDLRATALPDRVQRWLEAPTDVRELAIVGLAHVLAAELARRDDMTALAVEGLALQLLAIGARLPTADKRGRPPWLNWVEELLHARFTERLTLGEVARAAGVEPLRLARTFRAHHHVSMATYLRRLRVEDAMSRLAATDQSISAIATQTGFSDQSHLNRVFRRFTGLTPDRFRRMARPLR